MKTTAKRGRPRKFDEDLTLDRIMQVFWKNGYSATSLDDIAEATGLNRPSIYAAFGGKKAMFLKVIERFADQMEEHLRKAGQQVSGLKPRLKAIMSAAIDLYTGRTEISAAPFGCLAISTLPPVAATDQEFQAVLQQVNRRMDLGFADLIRGETKGALPETQVTNTAQHLSLVLHGLSVRARSGEEADSLRELAKDAVEKLVPDIA
ncbi:TetR/AcrR family transcriptional regulator [Roseibium sp.]|uniref:TetR/AcrR family transcriptional regulator n=1 Tax=Roseibium sp. TaxID=1936156 RepID=UPI003D0FE07C